MTSPGDRRDAREGLLWTTSQRRVLMGLVIGLLVYIIIQYWRHPAYVSDPQPLHPPREAELQDRIDPNTADWQTLAALPVIGEKRAKDIVAYREKFQEANPGQRAFARAEDLIRVKGIGEATVQSLAPYLIFPDGPGPSSTRAGEYHGSTQMKAEP